VFCSTSTSTSFCLCCRNLSRLVWTLSDTTALVGRSLGGAKEGKRGYDVVKPGKYKNEDKLSPPSLPLSPYLTPINVCLVCVCVTVVAIVYDLY